MTYTKTTDFDSWIQTQEDDGGIRDLCNDVKDYFSGYVLSSESGHSMKFRLRKTVDVAETCRSLGENKLLYLNYIRPVEGEDNVYAISYGVA